MKISVKEIKVRDLFSGYEDKGIDGVYEKKELDNLALFYYSSIISQRPWQLPSVGPGSSLVYK